MEIKILIKDMKTFSDLHYCVYARISDLNKEIEERKKLLDVLEGYGPVEKIHYDYSNSIIEERDRLQEFYKVLYE